jgi:hypothetical protein
MRYQIPGRVRIAVFALLQLAGFGLSIVLGLFLDGDHLVLVDLLLFLAGIAMGVVGLVRCARNGRGPWYLLGTSALIFVGCVFFWPIFGSVALALLRGLPGFGVRWSWQPALSSIPLFFFSTGSLAYFGLGPFRSNVSPRQIVRELVVGNRDLRIGGPARPEVVAKAERLLGLWLPTSFRDFLLDFGEIRGTAVTFLGLGPSTDLDHPSTDDFVGATLDTRERLALPQGYIVCSVDAGGQVACVDTTVIRNSESPVVLWSPDTRAAVRVAAPSFSQYLIDTLRSKARKP